MATWSFSLTPKQRAMISWLLAHPTDHPREAMIRVGYSVKTAETEWQSTIRSPKVAAALAKAGWIAPADLMVSDEERQIQKERRAHNELVKDLGLAPTPPPPGIKAKKPAPSLLDPFSAPLDMTVTKDLSKFTKERAFEESAEALKIALALKQPTMISNMLSLRAKLAGYLKETLEVNLPQITDLFMALEARWKKVSAHVLEDKSQVIDAEVVESKSALETQIADARAKLKNPAMDWTVPPPAIEPKPAPGKVQAPEPPSPTPSETVGFDRDKARFWAERDFKERARGKQAEGTDYPLFGGK